MPRMTLTWEEASGELPMVCPFCGGAADVLVTEEMKEKGTRHRVLWTVHRTAMVTLPRCRRHRRVWPHLFTLHVLWIEPDYIEFRNAHQDFIDAVEDYRDRGPDRRPRHRDRGNERDERGNRDERPRRRRRRRSESSPGWVVALIVTGAVLVLLVPCLCMVPFVVVKTGAPQRNQQPWPGPPGQPKWR